MAIELNRLIEKVSHMDITLIAGKNGISNLVSWVHMIETKEASNFLEGGEIAFSTGIGLSGSLSLLDLVENIWEHHAAGIVLNIGPFLEKIPDEIIEFGNLHDFPIFSVPWKIHIAEMMRIFSYAITKSDQKNLEIASAFKNAIFFPQQEELYLVPLSQYGFQTNWNYYICAMKVLTTDSHSVSQKRLDKLCMTLEHHLQYCKHKKYAIFNFENHLIAVAGNYSENMITDFASHIREYFDSFLHPNENYYISIGKCTKSIRCLYKSFGQALAIQKLQQHNKIDSSMISYSDMGIYKLILGIEDRDILLEYYEKTILPLQQFDEQSNSDFCVVLKCYLNHNGSVKETADELYVHRNTINYKLNKISELLNVNLSCLNTRLQLSLGFMLQDVL